MSNEWFQVKNVGKIDSPSVLIFKDRVEHNIDLLKKSIDDISRLRPHIKTHKSLEVSKMMMDHGITKFKCATIAEAEILGKAGAKDVVLAYQPVGPKAVRFHELTTAYPKTRFACLVDNESTAGELNKLFTPAQPAQVYIDINVGMNRTGIVPEEVASLFEKLQSFKSIQIVGLHAYDGHLRDTDFAVRKQKCDAAFEPVSSLKDTLEKDFNTRLTIIAGGSPTFPIHAARGVVECSPGTFVYWDKGYEQILQEQKFKHAAIVLTRVISKPAANIICVDLGHKAIAAENPLQNRVTFLNADGLEPIGQSEEHLVLKNNSAKTFEIGDVLYGVPYHVCPTIALHDSVNVVIENEVKDKWMTLSRNRAIEI